MLILCLENNTCHQIYSCSTSSALDQLPAGASCGKSPPTSPELCSITPGRDLACSICFCRAGREGFQLHSSDLALLPLAKALMNSHFINRVISALEPPHMQSSSEAGIAAVSRQCVELHPPIPSCCLPSCHPQSPHFGELCFPTLGLTLNGNVLALCGSFGFCRSTPGAILNPDPRNELS